IITLQARQAAGARQAVNRAEIALHPLPAQLTPLIGREHDVQVASSLLRRPEVRLLTFTMKPDFQIKAANMHVIAEICARLDGLPLSIELAAARIKLLSLQALLDRLDHRLELLPGSRRCA